MGLFTEVRIKNVYDALYQSGGEYFPIYDYAADDLDDLDQFAAEVMAEEGYEPPYYRVSAHIVGHEKYRRRR